MSTPDTPELPRWNKRACQSTKEELRELNLNVLQDCPICRDDYKVLCKVGCHPSTAATSQQVDRLSLKRPYEVGHEDDRTVQLIHNLHAVHLQSAEDLRHFLANEVNVHRIAVDAELQRFEYWDQYFVSKACDVVPSRECCVALSNTLCCFAASSIDVSMGSENSIIAFMDLALRPIEHLARRPRERNVTNKTSGKYKPDGFIPMGIHGAACVTLEEKPLRVYRKGVMGSDPELENIEKIDFTNWKNLYGNAPFIICFSVVADNTTFQVKMGAIEYASKSLVQLDSWDLTLPGARAQFAFKLVQLLPVLKGIIEDAENALIPMMPITTYSADRMIVKTIQAIQCPALATVLVEKEWSHLQRPTDVPAILTEFTRMDRVFDAIGDNNIHARFGVLKRVTHDALRFHTVGMSTIGGIPTADPTSERMGMKGFFSPYGVPYHPTTPKNLAEVILSVAYIVEFLHTLKIVHNDIRWSNLCAVELPEGTNPVRMLLFDFDDAFLMHEEMCPGLHHLSEQEHPKKCQDVHGGEVDVWAIGMLINQHAQSSAVPALHALGADILDRFEVIEITEIVVRLEILVSEL